MTAVLSLVDVRKRYPGGFEAVRGVSLAVDPGESMAIVGPSGSGKTTLLHVIGTLERPSAGSVLVGEVDVAGLRDRPLAALRAKRIGFVFQRFFLIEPMTAVDNVAEGLRYRDIPRKERRSHAERALEQVGLSHRFSYPAAKLSGGERQRVAIARAIVGAPDVVLADEPTGNLDSRAGDAVISLLAELAPSLVVVTHDHAVASCFPRNVEMHDGRVVRDERA